MDRRSDRALVDAESPGLVTNSDDCLPALQTQEGEPKSRKRESTPSTAESVRQHVPTQCVAPRTPTETALAEIWKEVLAQKEISVFDDLFNLGGDSLLAARANARIGDLLGVEVSIYELFERPTLEDLASRLTSAIPAYSPIHRKDRSRDVPLSSAQHRLWFVDQLEGGSRAYDIPLCVRLTAALDERCDEIENTSLELVSFYEWIQEIKRTHQEGRSLPAVPLVEFAFSMDAASFHEHQRAIRSEGIRFDCTRTHRALEHAGIVAPALDDDLLRGFLESMLSRDAELRDCLTAMRSHSSSSVVLTADSLKTNDGLRAQG